MPLQIAAPSANAARMSAVLAQLDRIPDRPDATDPLQWDALGLPRSKPAPPMPPSSPSAKAAGTRQG